jgi:pyruvate formate lyase activating enzyme
MAEIEPSLPFIRGLTVSGGECTRYPDFLRGLGDLAHRMSRTFFLDSNGSYDFAGDPALMEAVDSVMLDIKADPENLAEYRRVTGCGEEHLLAQTEFLARAGKLWEIRTVVSPGLFDAVKVVDRICRFLAGLKLPEPRPQYKLIRYRSMGVRKEAAALLQAPGEELMAKLAGICAGYGVQAVIV